MEKAALNLGLEADTAKQLIIQTMLGTADMFSIQQNHPQRLRKEVTSPGGTTEAGLKVLAANLVGDAFISCIEEATAQSKRMGKQISEELAKYIVTQ